MVSSSTESRQVFWEQRLWGGEWLLGRGWVMVRDGRSGSREALARPPGEGLLPWVLTEEGQKLRAE